MHAAVRTSACIRVSASIAPNGLANLRVPMCRTVRALGCLCSCRVDTAVGSAQCQGVFSEHIGNHTLASFCMQTGGSGVLCGAGSDAGPDGGHARRAALSPLCCAGARSGHADAPSLSAAPVAGPGPPGRRAEAKHTHLLHLLRK